MGQLEDMQVFVRVVDAGSLVKASDQLGIAKSAVSRRLAELEKRLGVKLLSRTTRSSSLTEAGRFYYQRALGVLDDVAELNSQTVSEGTRLEGSLHVAAPVSFGLAHLSPALADFCQAHPDLDVHLNFSDRHVDLVEEGVDLAIRIGDLSESSLRARRLCPVQLCLCASPEYLARMGEPLTPDDLYRHHLLRYDATGGHQWRLTSADGQAFRINLKPRLTANNGDFLRDMAVAGQGIVASPTFICSQALAAGQLQPLLTDYCLPQLNAYAVYPPTRYLSQRARVLIDFLASRFGEEPYWDKEAALAPGG